MKDESKEFKDVILLFDCLSLEVVSTTEVGLEQI